MLSLLFLGFLIGLAHAFEADHMAAVSSLVSGQTKRRSIIQHGALWGVGHSLTLFVVGGGVLITGSAISPQVATGLEFTVGLMLLALGAHVLYRLHRDRVHFHMHGHNDGTAHLHLHSHADEPRAHDAERHRHSHPDHAALRTLAIGMMHGLAGSAALVLVVAASMSSLLTGVGYILLFGAGSVLGMALMSLAIAVPLKYTAKSLTRLNGVLQLMIGLFTIGIGVLTVFETSKLLFS